MVKMNQRKQFEDLISKLHEQKAQNSKIMIENEYNKLLQRITGVRETGPSASNKNDYYLLKTYDLQKIESSYVIIHKISGKIILHLGEYFEVIKVAHQGSGHGGRQATTKLLNEKYYNITQQIVSLFIETCEHCQHKKKTIQKKGEIQLLTDICSKFTNIIENKQNDPKSWKQKDEAWEKIAEQFNAQSGSIDRDGNALRMKYDCLKRDHKLETVLSMSEEDLPDNSNIPSTSKNNKEFVVGESEGENIASLIQVEPDIYENSDPVNTIKTNGANWATLQKRNKKKLFLKTNRSNVKYNSIASDRENLIKIQTENALQEKELLAKKLMYLDQEHELIMKKLRLEIKEKEIDLVKKGINF